MNAKIWTLLAGSSFAMLVGTSACVVENADDDDGIGGSDGGSDGDGGAGVGGSDQGGAGGTTSVGGSGGTGGSGGSAACQTCGDYLFNPMADSLPCGGSIDGDQLVCDSGTNSCTLFVDLFNAACDSSSACVSDCTGSDDLCDGFVPPSSGCENCLNSSSGALQAAYNDCTLD